MTTPATIAATFVILLAIRSTLGRNVGEMKSFSGRALAIFSTGAFATFLLLLMLVVNDVTWLGALDRQLLAGLSSLRTPTIVHASLAFSALVSSKGLTLLTLAVLALVWWRCGRRPAIVFTMVAIGGLLYKPLKLVVGRVRPDEARALVFEQGLAFPSGHALASATVFAGVCWAIHQMTASRIVRELATLGTITALIWIPMSRLVLGVHWPSDVVGGLALGAAWTSLVALLLGRYQAGPASSADTDS